MRDARSGVTHDGRVASPVTPNIYSPVQTPSPDPETSVPPSVSEGREGESNDASNRDGGTDEASTNIDVQEAGPASADESEPAAADAALKDGSSSEGGSPPRPAATVVRVEMTPGVEVLRAIAAEAGEWTITHAQSLRDQGLVVSGMLEEGFTPQEIRHALLSRPLPQPLRTTVAAVVGRRLRDLMAAGPSAGVRPIPAQHRSTGGEQFAQLALGERESWTPPPVDVHSVRETHRPCAGEDDMCPRLALPGEDLCGVCLGGEQPVCASGCGRGVTAAGVQCMVCADAETTQGICPGHGRSCGAPAGSDGLCGRCRVSAGQARRAADTDWEQTLAAATAAVAAGRQAPSAPF